MRVTAEIDEATYEHVQQRARMQNISMSRLLGELIGQALEASPVRTGKSGRFTVILDPPGAPVVTAEQIQRIIDRDGYL